MFFLYFFGIIFMMTNIRIFRVSPCTLLNCFIQSLYSKYLRSCHFFCLGLSSFIRFLKKIKIINIFFWNFMNRHIFLFIIKHLEEIIVIMYSVWSSFFLWDYRFSLLLLFRTSKLFEARPIIIKKIFTIIFILILSSLLYIFL